MRPANPYFFESLILLQVGKRYAAKVVKMMDYGVFVELSSGSQGLLHISEIALEKVLPLPPPCCYHSLIPNRLSCLRYCLSPCPANHLQHPKV